MPSPFPGMDPYLEGFLWPDMHQALATKVRQMLVPLVQPKYVVRLEVQVIEDNFPEDDIGIMYPDVEVLRTNGRKSDRSSAGPGAHTSGLATITPAPLSVPVLPAMSLKVVNIHVRKATNNRLVTSIEIISPVNKRRPGFEPYQAKRQRMIEAGVHLLEFDLLRRGQRPVRHKRIPACDYLVAVTRSATSRTDLWPLSIRDPLPSLPVPLKQPDEDVPLDLGAALRAIYDEASYDLSIDYDESPPPPEFAAEDRKWIARLIRGRRTA